MKCAFHVQQLAGQLIVNGMYQQNAGEHITYFSRRHGPLRIRPGLTERKGTKASWVDNFCFSASLREIFGFNDFADAKT